MAHDPQAIKATGQRISAMSSLADSEATFQAKAGSYGLSDAVLKALQTKGIATYGQLLFSVASAPGQVDEAKRKTLFQAFPQEFQGEPTEGIISRLLFEAGTFVVAELKGSLESADDAPRRKDQQNPGSKEEVGVLAHWRSV